jgi:hypothetical protein
MTQSTTKIQGKFYPLQHEEWLYACRELTQAQRAVKQLCELQLIVGQLFGFDQKNDIEHQICDRLKLELGGEVEVITAVGRIDLLTAFEVIEIKNINNWKEALGKILAYSAFFPEHSKRIHLFGCRDCAKLALAQATCSEFEITVTFEEVKSS